MKKNKELLIKVTSFVLFYGLMSIFKMFFDDVDFTILAMILFNQITGDNND